jgi:molecular chaperone GrpE
VCADKLKKGEKTKVNDNHEPEKKNSEKKNPTKKDKLADMKTQLKVMEDKHLRLKAEFENFRRRKEKDIIQLLEYDGLRLVEKILPIVDDFDRMLHATNNDSKDNNDSSLKTGAELVYQKIIKFLEDIQVKPFGKSGELIDAELHDAMLARNEKKKQDGEIIEVFEKGYFYKDKVVRHAKVIVNKK